MQKGKKFKYTRPQMIHGRRGLGLFLRTKRRRGREAFEHHPHLEPHDHLC
ncbi:unnamed protein product, partial [Brassica oleracea var. botrytis]